MPVTSCRSIPYLSSSSSPTTIVPGRSSKDESTLIGIRSRMARPTERVCSTLAPTLASSSISSKVMIGSFRARGTMRGSVV